MIEYEIPIENGEIKMQVPKWLKEIPHPKKIRTRFVAPKLPECCVRCGGLPPLVAEAMSKRINERVVEGSSRYSVQYRWEDFTVSFYLCKSCSENKAFMNRVIKQTLFIALGISVVIYFLVFIFNLMVDDTFKRQYVLWAALFMLIFIFSTPIAFLVKLFLRELPDNIKSRWEWLLQPVRIEYESFHRSTTQSGPWPDRFSSDHLDFIFTSTIYAEQFCKTNGYGFIEFEGERKNT